LNLLLIRFALVVIAVVIVALLVFAAALAVKRRHGMDQVHRYARSAARAAITYVDDRDDAGRPPTPRRRDTLLGVVVRAAARYVRAGRNGSRGAGGGR
jgi:hypothetical protein